MNNAAHFAGAATRLIHASNRETRFVTRFRVADWDVDPAINRVSRGEQVFKLEPKVMEVLVYLAGRPGQVVTRAELEDAIWTETIVGYDAVTGSIQKLRKVLGDNSKQPRIIETISKRGYRLVASVTQETEESFGKQQNRVTGEAITSRPVRLSRSRFSVRTLIVIGIILSGDFSGLASGARWTTRLLLKIPYHP